MSEDPHHGATTIHASKSGAMGKLVLGVVAAALVLGGGYYAWTQYGPSQEQTEIAYNEESYVDDPLRAGPADEQNPLAESAAADDVTAEPAAEEPSAAPARRAPARSAAAAPVPQATIGVTPANAAPYDSDEIVVPAPRRPIWAHTPSARRLSAMYPQRALDRGRDGEASLACVVQNGGVLDCDRVSETPGGFGNAALRVARAYRHSTQLADGSSAVGTPVNLRVVFRINQEPNRGNRVASR